MIIGIFSDVHSCYSKMAAVFNDMEKYKIDQYICLGDIIGYGKALEEFDRQLPLLYQKMNADDLLILTADHGNDPSWHGSDHTREHVPILLFQHERPSENHGFRETFADIAQTIAQTFHLSSFQYGKPLDI